MTTSAATTASAAVSQAADSAVDEIMEGLDFSGDAAAEGAQADDATAVDGAVDGAADAAVEADAGEQPAAEEGAQGAQADDAAAAVEGDGAADAPAAEEAAAAVEGDGAAAVAEETAAPPVTAAAPAEDPQAAARAQAQAQAYTKWEQDFQGIESKIAANKYDPIDDGPTAVATLAQGMKFVKQAIGELHAQQEQFRQEQAAEKFWTDWGRANPTVGVEKGRKAFEEEFATAIKKHGDPRVATAVAEERWAMRMKIAAGVAKPKPGAARVARPAAAAAAATPNKGAAPAAGTKPAARPAGKPPAPVTQGGGRVLPPSTVKAPPTRPKSFAEKRDSGAYGNFTDLVD